MESPFTHRACRLQPYSTAQPDCSLVSLRLLPQLSTVHVASLPLLREHTTHMRSPLPPAELVVDWRFACAAAGEIPGAASGFDGVTST